MLFTWIKLKIATCNYDRQDCFRTERNNVKCVWYKHWPVEVRFVSSFWDSLKNWHGFSLIWPKMIPAQGLLNKAGWHNIGLITQQVSIGLKQYGDRAICTKHQKGGKRVLCVFFLFFSYMYDTRTMPTGRYKHIFVKKLFYFVGLVIYHLVPKFYNISHCLP